MANAAHVGPQRPTSTTLFIEHYGVHWTPDGLAFLEQGGPKGGSNATGQPIKSPFHVRSRRPCNHNIALATPGLGPAHTQRFFEINDPLIQAMKPLPKEDLGTSVWYIDDNRAALGLHLQLLSRMSSPIKGIVVPVWTMDPATITEEMGMTNVQPLVLTHVEVKHSELVARIASSASLLPRRLILVGKSDVPLPSQVVRITPTIDKLEIGDLMILPWEVYGATLVRRYMRGENAQT